MAWIALGWLGTVLVSALAGRLQMAHLMPNMALVVVVFLAMRKEAPEICVTALVLGHIVGITALSPSGLHEMALMLVGLSAFLIGGNLSATGSIYVGCVCVLADMGYHILLVLLLIWQGHAVGFSSWATAALVPQALMTGFWGWALYGAFEWLDDHLAPRHQEGLQWR